MCHCYEQWHCNVGETTFWVETQSVLFKQHQQKHFLKVSAELPTEQG